jgi:hypothetical protein
MLRYVVILGGLLAGGMVGLVPITGPPIHAAAGQQKPAVSEEISAAPMRMGKTLRADQFAFQARTIRMYSDARGRPLHIVHTLKVTMHRPDGCLSM